MRKVYIISASRTPIGSFQGALSSVSASKLGSIAIKDTLKQKNIPSDAVDEVFMGNVLQAGVGQAPARQAAILSGLGEQVPCTTVNKVCASGMKALILGTQSIKCGDADVVVVGGMENMSQVPHYLNKSRTGQKLGNLTLTDGMVSDGLTDAYNNVHMGVLAESCAEKMNINREQQDKFAIESYSRSTKAWKSGAFNGEMCTVEIPQKRGEPLLIDQDEEYKNIKLDKIAQLKPVFKKEGTITAANASTLNDGAAALILMSEEKINKLGIEPMAEVMDYADAAREPEWFTIAPEKAISKILSKNNLTTDNIDAFELNEAFSVVGIANARLLGIDPNKVNINGGAVSLGHPLGCSGARILVTLVHILKEQNLKHGIAGICNGGGGASAVLLRRM